MVMRLGQNEATAIKGVAELSVDSNGQIILVSGKGSTNYTKI